MTSEAGLAPTGRLQILLAPLRGFTDAVFRSVYTRHFAGIDLAVAPFVVAAGGRASLKPLADLKPEANRAMPVVPQVLGNDPEAFLSLAGRLADLGYRSVNWNLGCPFPMVARKGRGSGLLPHPERIADFLERVATTLALRLSVKTRLGYRDPDEIFRLLPILARHRLEAVVIHPRTGIQIYEGRVDLDRFGACLAATRLPVVYNGDITNRRDFEHLVQRFAPVTQWMVGRGVLIDPFLPARLRNMPLPADPAAVLRGFCNDLTEAYARRLSGPGHLLDRMKGFWRYLSMGFEDRQRVWRLVRRAGDMDDYRQTVGRIFEAYPLTPPDSLMLVYPQPD
jgi:tRNA-dihydrouridine synthase B